CKIVIVEEAAEIFEAHVISSLTEKCEHLILIGDHQQLRPNPTVYRLAKTYNIDVSLFERLVRNDFPSVRLNVQHRMRLEICALMKHFYNDLQNHDSVKSNRPSILGIRENVFFITHSHKEEVTDNSSKQNYYEAQYIIELAHFLTKQGYSTSQITVLVMYIGQKHLLTVLKQRKFSKVLEGLQITTVDNYQGEENDIIILSLVRNNVLNDVGFLKIQNRICVALSRARCGLYILGNLEMMQKTSEMWKNLAKTFHEMKAVGKGLNLCCTNHPKAPFVAVNPQSFARRPDDPQEHGRCKAVVDKKIVECQHPIKFECSKIPTIQDCKQTFLIKLPCDHLVQVPCQINQLKVYDSVDCPTPCNQQLLCGHKCRGTCGSCQHGQLHKQCREKCDKELICGHLSNCGHAIERTELDQYMNNFMAQQDEHRFIRLPKCPRCAAKIYQCKRYQHILNHLHSWIEKVKSNQQDSKASYQKQQKLIIRRNFYVSSSESVRTIIKSLNIMEEKSMNEDELNYVENTLVLLRELDPLLLFAKNAFMHKDQEVNQKVNYWIGLVVSFMGAYKYRYTPQQLNDIKQELDRIKGFMYLHLLMKEMQLKSIEPDIDCQKMLNELKTLTTKYSSFTTNDCEIFYKIFNHLVEKLNIPVLGVRRSIQMSRSTTTIDSRQENWFYCVNGHTYVGKDQKPISCPQCQHNE
ncbi:unnamed protein product, partial [Didymodactylos carnosus]